ncbi:MAG: Ldh family oxidoreductase, partial [Sphingobacteriia bacterium]
LHETPSTATLDGDAGLGLVIGPKAMRLAMTKAATAGTGWVAVQNSNHFGIAGYHAMLPLSQQMIGMAMTNASALVAPTHSTERLLGTNPIAVAIPANQEAPFVADMATTAVANGKLEVLQRKGKDMPLGWAQDAQGQASTDPSILKKGGAMLPLGSDPQHSSHKGYALGSIADIFSAILSGASYGPWVPPFPAYVPMPENMPGKGLGHFMGALRIDAFRPAEDFLHHMDHWLHRFRQASAIDPQQPVLVPGDPERKAEAQHRKEGIVLLAPVIEDLAAVAKQLGLDNC